MRIAPIRDTLLQAGCKRVYGALEFAGIKAAGLPPLPAFFVVPGAEGAKPNRLDGAHDQLVEPEFTVVVMLPAQARLETQVSDQLHEESERVKRALAGWMHPDASRACDYAGGRLLSVDGQALAWGASFRMAGHLRKAG